MDDAYGVAFFAEHTLHEACHFLIVFNYQDVHQGILFFVLNRQRNNACLTVEAHGDEHAFAPALTGCINQ